MLLALVACSDKEEQNKAPVESELAGEATPAQKDMPSAESQSPQKEAPSVPDDGQVFKQAMAMLEGESKNEPEAVRLLRELVGRDYAPAQHQLGLCYIEGRGVEVDVGNALSWFRRAAEQGHAPSQNTMGLLLMESDPQASVAWFRQAAEQGEAEAQYNMAFCLQQGKGVEKDEQAAFPLLREAAGQGFAPALHELGLCYIQGRGVEADRAEGISLLEKAVALEHVPSMLALAEQLRDTAPERVLPLYQKAADSGDAPAQRLLALCYANGRGTALDMASAALWFRKAGAQNDLISLCNLGVMAIRGLGVDVNAQAGAELLHHAAKAGYAPAQFNYAICLEEGIGGEAQPSEALVWYTKAAEQGDAEAAASLARCYEQGVGTAKDPSKAIEWLRRAAEVGDVESMEAWGTNLKEGRGVSKNVAEGEAWLQKARVARERKV